jgi:hypothetical protein
MYHEQNASVHLMPPPENPQETTTSRVNVAEPR